MSRKTPARRGWLARRLRPLLGVVVGSLVLTGCSFDVYDLPLPGGADVGDDPISVTVYFEDVLDLVPQSAVKVNDISVGRVESVELDSDTYDAKVELLLRNDTGLPDNPIATIRQTSLLGEKFVSLEAPPTGASADALGEGDTIPVEDTGRNPEVEEVLGALSLVLNGGGVAQLKTITSELNLALEGREDSARSVLTQVESLMGQLDDNKADIVNAIRSLNRLAIGVRQQQGSIDAALEELPSALDSIDRQRGDLVRMLEGLNRLGDVGVRVINQTEQATIDSLQQLFPVLDQINEAGDAFVDAFHVFYAFPFVDEVVGRDPQVAQNLHMGDYVNLAIDLDLDLNNLVLPDIACIPFKDLPDSPLDELIDLPNLCAGVTKALQQCLRTPPNPDGCLKLPGYLLDEICDAVALPLLCRPAGPGTDAGQDILAGDDPISDLLDQITGGLGLGRIAPGEEIDPVDPGLAALLVTPATGGTSS